MFNRVQTKSPKFVDSTNQLSNTKKKTNNSYLEQHRMKKNVDFLDYEIVDHGGYFYQGCYLKGGEKQQRIKDGQGIILTKKGQLIIGKWIKNNLQGRCVIFTPFGGTINANFVEGKLDGWCIASYLNKIIVCTLYYNDKIDGEKLIYEDKEKLWVASKYNKEGQFQKIIHVQNSGNSKVLPSFVDQSDLSYLLTSFHKNIGYDLLNTNRIKFINITKDILYIGYADEKDQPTGLGLLCGFQQHYAGNFKNGVLQIYGRILFESGSIYHGQLLDGQFHGIGCYYDLQTNCSCIVQSENNEILEKKKQFPGYIGIQIQTKLGRKLKANSLEQEAVDSRGLAQLCSFLEQYYSCFMNQLIDMKLREMSLHSQYSSIDHAAEIQILKKQNKQNATPKPQKFDSRWFVLRQNQGVSEQQFEKQGNFQLENHVAKNNNIQLNNSDSLEVPVKLHKVYSLQKKYIGQKYDINNFQTIPIQQLQNVQQSEAYSKNLPKQEVINNKKNLKLDKVKSMDPGQITFRYQHQNQQIFQIKPVKVDTELNPKLDSSSNNMSFSVKSSQISDLSVKMAHLIVPSKTIRSKSNRKRIFQ